MPEKSQPEGKHNPDALVDELFNVIQDLSPEEQESFLGDIEARITAIRERLPQQSVSGNMTQQRLDSQIAARSTAVVVGVTQTAIEALNPPEEDRPLYLEATQLVNHIQQVEFQPFQSHAFRIRRQGDQFEGEFFNVSSIPMSDDWPSYHPQNFLGVDYWQFKTYFPGGLRQGHISMIGNVFHEKLRDIAVLQKIYVMSIPDKDKVILGLNGCEFGFGRPRASVLILDVDDIDGVEAFVTKHDGKGLNALLSLLTSEEITPVFDNVGGDKRIPFGRANLFFTGNKLSVECRRARIITHPSGLQGFEGIDT